MELPKTLTEAQTAGQIHVLDRGANPSQSGREFPYSEVYRASNGLMETPAQLLQRVADETREAESA